MAEAYKVLADTSFPTAIRKTDELIDGQEVYEVVGVAYSEGDYVLESALTPRDRERAANGELDHLLEPADASDVVENDEKGVFIPEHEAEAFVLDQYGHEVVPPEQVLELKSAGAEEAQAAQEAAKADGADERDLPGVSQEEPVDAEKLADVEQPPGVVVGDKKVAAEASEDAAPKRRTRKAKEQPVAEEQKSE